MVDRITRIDLIIEDVAQERFVRALIYRLSRIERMGVTIKSSIMGGEGRVRNEIKGFQRALRKQVIPGGIPDMLIILVDSNCDNYNHVKREVDNIVDKDLFPNVVIGCPDPHAERWFFADRDSFFKLFGFFPDISLTKCEQDYYKNELKNAIKKAGWPTTQGGIEYAKDIIDEMDFLSMTINDESLKTFIDDIKAALKLIKKSMLST